MLELSNSTITTISGRRSIRKYSGETVTDEALAQLLEAGRWAPSGLNNQPWRFAVLKDKDLLDKTASLTKYSSIIKGADICIAVFFHKPSGYNRDKDLMAVGACVQNMLLAAHSLSLGAVWLGEILNRKDEFNSLHGINSDYELCALIAIGHPAEKGERSRKPLEELIIS
jgi:nitroreductase